MNRKKRCGHEFFYSGYDRADAARLLEAEGFRIGLREVDDPSSRGRVAIIATRN